MSKLIRMDQTGHSTLAEWTEDNPEACEAAIRAFRRELDEGCIGMVSEGPGKATLPFTQPVSTGDTDAFEPQGSVRLTVTDFSGSPSCEVRLVSVDTGRPVELATLTPKQASTVLDPQGSTPVYLADPECTVRVSDAG